MAQGHIARSERLEARLTAEQKIEIEEAARIRGQSVSDFVVSSAQEAAQRAIAERQIMRLSKAAQKAFVDALLNPPKPNQHALKAVRRYRKELGLQ